MAEHKVGILTAGGLAPYLSAATGALIEHYTELDPSIDILCYRSGYKGLLLGDSILVTSEIRERASILQQHGGSPIGNSRVKLTNVDDCIKRGLVKDGESPLAIAAKQLEKDGITILHTIGGDDTNTMAAALSHYLGEHDYRLTVVGMPKTVDNDVYPIGQSLGAVTAAEQGARFFENVVNEFSANPRMLIIHEVMGRHCGWLTAATAQVYRDNLAELEVLDELGLSRAHKDVHAVWIPEMPIDIEEEAKRLRAVMDNLDCVNIFLSEGAGVESIVKEIEAAGQPWSVVWPAVRRPSRGRESARTKERLLCTQRRSQYRRSKTHRRMRQARGSLGTRWSRRGRRTRRRPRPYPAGNRVPTHQRGQTLRCQHAVVHAASI